MRDAPWQRVERIREVRTRIWSYVTQSSKFESSDLLVAAGLLGWPDDDLLRLAELHFVLTPSVGHLLESLPTLSRRLRSSVLVDQRIQRSRLDGPIQWGPTLARRSVEGSVDLYVTSPTRRAHQTPENELLAHVMDGVVAAARASGWHEGEARHGPSIELQRRLAEFEMWQQHRAIAGIERTQPTTYSVNRVRTGRFSLRYEPALLVYDDMHALVETLDRDSIARAIERTALVTSTDSTLFELMTLFATIDALKAAGWRLSSVFSFSGQLVVTGGKDGGGELTLWYQSVPPDLSKASKYRKILRAHGLSRQVPRRPDLVLRWKDNESEGQRTLFMECKLIQSGGGVIDGVRYALADLFSYRQDFASVVASEGVYGLGVAWGYGLAPATVSDVLLCTLDYLPTALAQAMSSFMTSQYLSS